MAINFPREEDDMPPAEALMAYKQLVDYHLYFLKQQSKCEFFYWNGLGIFFLLTMGFFFSQSKAFVLHPFIGIFITGIGSLVILLRNMREDFEYGIQAEACVEKGLRIEKKYDYPAKLFSIFEDNKLVTYRGSLLSRLFPTGLIGLATTGAATLLAMKIGTWLAVVVAVFSTVVLSIMARSYVRTAKKIILRG